MADIQLSGIGVVAINGSLGTTTFARNYYGTYAKTRLGMPTPTAYTALWQAEVSSLSAVWQFGFTDADRLLWYSVSRIIRDAFGNVKTLTGYDLYMSVNLNLFLIGIAPVTVPPAESIPLQIGTPQIVTADTTWIEISLDVPQNTYVAIFVSWGLPPGRMSSNQIYAWCSNWLFTGADQVIYTTLGGRVGALTTGEKRWIKLVPINDATGTRGVPKFVSAIIS